MKPYLMTLLALAALSCAACDKKKDDAKPAEGDKSAKTEKTDKKKEGDKADTKKEGDKADTKKEAEKPKEAAKPLPKLAPLALKPWGLTIMAPEGTKLGEFESGDGDFPDTVKLETEKACGWDVELYRDPKSAEAVKSMFTNATKPSGNKNDQYQLKEMTDAGYKVRRSWVIPLGDTMHSVELGVVIDGRQVRCGLSAISGASKAEADCGWAICTTLAKAK